MAFFETVTDLRAQAEILRRRRYGVIEVAGERLVGVHLRPWPKLISIHEGLWFGGRYHRRHEGNRCLLYYNQPRAHSNFLALKYVRSSRGTTLATFRATLTLLDEIARIKGTDATVTDVSNLRISDRLLRRWGWEAHCASRWHRHFIKRYYGAYPAPDAAWGLMSPLALSAAPALLCGTAERASTEHAIESSPGVRPNVFLTPQIEAEEEACNTGTREPLAV